MIGLREGWTWGMVQPYQPCGCMSDDGVGKGNIQSVMRNTMSLDEDITLF